MGTHISRVKSVDLDSWTDEQLQSVLNWGNARANKYWEAKLAPGHTPSESKIENFIRTKYELKRWAMDGPRPDPATLDVDGDDDVPLSLVKEKQVIERKESIRKASVGQSQAPRNISAPQDDLIGGEDPITSRTAPPTARVTPKAEPAAPKATNARDSLLGLDFLGGSAAPPRPASTPGMASSGGQSRPDLKQSILSLYASVPKAQSQQASQQNSFGGMGTSNTNHQARGSIGGFDDAFGSLSLSSTTNPKPAANDPFASFGGAGSSARNATQPSHASAFGGLSGGGFFDTKPASQSSIPSRQQKPSNSGFEGFPSFSSPPPTQTATAPPPKPSQSASSAMGDLFDLSAPVSHSSPPPPPRVISPPASTTSVFNLSAPQTKPEPPVPAAASASFGSALSGVDVWGSNEWSSPAPAPAPVSAPVTASSTIVAPAAPVKPAEQPKSPAADFGWSTSFADTPIIPGTGGGFNPAPKVTADEEFGGWTSSTGAANPSTAGPAKASGGFDEDLFSNVWQ